MMARIHRDQAGLVGKIAVVWLLFAAVFVVGLLDGISILLAKYRVQDLAGNAASDAAYAYKQTNKLAVACQAAFDYVASHDPDAKIPGSGCSIDPTSGDATITVRKVAGTLVAKRLSFTQDLTHEQATETVSPPL